MSQFSYDKQLEDALRDDDPEIIIEVLHNNCGKSIVNSIPPTGGDLNLKLDAWIETLSTLGYYIETGRLKGRPIKNGTELYKLAFTICQRRHWRLLKRFGTGTEQYDDKHFGKEDTQRDFVDVVLDEEAFLQDVDIHLSRLSDKQFEVIKYASNNPDATDKEIAKSLGVSPKSVESSLRQAREKLITLRDKWPTEYFQFWLGAIQNEYEKRT